MIELRKHQMEALEQLARRQFADRAAKELRPEFPEISKSLGRAGMRERLLRVMNQAAGYGLTSEEQVMGFARVSFQWGDGFHASLKHEWANEILSNYNQGPDNRVRQLMLASRRRAARAVPMEAK
jgi:hypothetical protein